MPDRVVKTTLVIDEHGAVKAVHSVGDESSRTEHKLGSLDKSVKGLGKSFGGLKSMIGAGLGALGVGGLAFGLEDVASKTNEIALATEKFHTQTGLSATSSLYYDKALKARGLSSEAVGKAFGFLSKNVRSAELQEQSFANTQLKAAAKGKISTSVLGRQAAAFKELGINLTAFNKLSEQQKLEQVTKKFEALPAGMKKTRLERELFGRGGNELSIVLEKGNLGLTHQIELVKKYFPTVKGGANAMNELIEKQTESKLAWEGLEFTLGQKLIPVMTEVMAWFSKTALEVEKGEGAWGSLRRDLEGVYNAGKGVVGFFENLGKAFNIKVGSGGLGAALATFAGVKIAAKVAKPVKPVAKVATKAGKYLVEHPYLAPAAIPAGAAAAYGYDVYRSRDELAAHAKGALNMFKGGPSSQREIEESFLGGKPGTRYGPGGVPRAGGHAAAGAETPGEAALVARLIASLTPTNDKAEIHLHLDSIKVAEAVIHNPRARRVIAEATAIYAQGMTARK